MANIDSPEAVAALIRDRLASGDFNVVEAGLTRPTIVVVGKTHLDHGVPKDQFDWALEAAAKLLPESGPAVVTLELPEELGLVSCGLHGPLMGDDPVGDEEVVLESRNGRAGASRLVERGLRMVRQITVICGPYGDQPWVLYTIHGGPAAPREPWDSSLDDAEREASRAFWSEHALSR